MPKALLPNCASSIRPAIVALALLGASAVHAAEPSLADIQEQNRLLRAQLDTQQKQIDELRAEMKTISEQHDVGSSPASSSTPSTNDSGDRRLVVSGEIGIAFFSQSRDGQYRNDEFRVDDADFRFEAPLAHDIFFYSELQIAKRESLDENFHMGEMYLEYENLSGALGGPDRLANVRFGRVNIPFGEEYQYRNPLEDPLVTHSLSDIWGTDEGIELYGEYGHASYAAAVQNGSSKTSRDFNADKALTLRIGYDITPRVHVSASAMRTGKLQSANEPLSEIWIGNNVFRNIGSAQSTVHQAEIGELDARYNWKNGHLLAALGRARYSDNDPLADNTRHFRFYQVEGVQAITHELYGAIRFSSLSVDGDGYPLAGIGNFSKYFLTSLRTKDLQRTTVGGGYRFNQSLLLKAEYTYEDGELVGGTSRDNHMFSFESALGF